MTNQYKLTITDKKKWIENQIEFLKPMVAFVFGLYVIPIISKLGEVGHVVSLQDFIPSNAVVTAIVLYLINAVYDLVRKWASPK